LSASAALQTPFANPILLVDPDLDLGRGLLHQLTRHGFCADLAITTIYDRFRRQSMLTHATIRVLFRRHGPWSRHGAP